jgi:hypothetical protein
MSGILITWYDAQNAECQVEVMAFNGLSLPHISFKFLSSAAPTRHLIQVLRGYFDVFLLACDTKRREHFMQK